MKQFASWFTHGVPGGAILRKSIYEAKSGDAVLAAVDAFLPAQPETSGRRRGLSPCLRRIANTVERLTGAPRSLVSSRWAISRCRRMLVEDVRLLAQTFREICRRSWNLHPPQQRLCGSTTCCCEREKIRKRYLIRPTYAVSERGHPSCSTRSLCRARACGR